MNSELFVKVSQREERVDRVKAFPVFPVATLHFAIVPWGVGADELVADAKISGGFLKKGLDIPFAVGKTVCEFKTIIGLDTLHTDTPAGIPLHQPFQEVGGRVSGLLRIGRQEAEPGKLVNGSILEQAQFWVRDTTARDDLHIHLDSFSRMSHLLVRLWCVCLFLLLLWKHPQLAHDAEQALRAAGIAALFQAMPQLH